MRKENGEILQLGPFLQTEHVVLLAGVDSCSTHNLAHKLMEQSQVQFQKDCLVRHLRLMMRLKAVNLSWSPG